MPPPRLEEVRWDADGLREALQGMLKRNRLAALDMLRAFDKSNDGVFSQKEVRTCGRATCGLGCARADVCTCGRADARMLRTLDHVLRD